MDESALEKLGMSLGERKVYLALNMLGESTIGPIVKTSRVSKSKIYDILDRLMEKGLAGYITKNGVKNYFIHDPHMLLEYLGKKEKEVGEAREEVLKILPGLMMQRKSQSSKRIAEIYEGFHGIKAIREELMESLGPKDTLLVLGAPKIANEKWEGWFLKFHKRRIERGAPMKIIYNADAREYGAIRRGMEITQVKYLPNNLVSPNWIDIYPDAVLFVMVMDTPVAFVVRDSELAKSFHSYFGVMWKNSSR